MQGTPLRRSMASATNSQRPSTRNLRQFPGFPNRFLIISSHMPPIQLRLEFGIPRRANLPTSITLKNLKKKTNSTATYRIQIPATESRFESRFSDRNSSTGKHSSATEAFSQSEANDPDVADLWNRFIRFGSQIRSDWCHLQWSWPSFSSAATTNSLNCRNHAMDHQRSSPLFPFIQPRRGRRHLAQTDCRSIASSLCTVGTSFGAVKSLQDSSWKRGWAVRGQETDAEEGHPAGRW